MLKTKGHQVAGKILRNLYTFLDLRFFPSSRSSEGFTPCPSGWRVLSRRCIHHLRKDQGMTGMTPMLTPHSQQMSCRFIVYTYMSYWDVFQNWNRSIYKYWYKSIFYSKISVPKQKLPTSWRLSSKRMCLSFNLSKAAIDSWFVVYSYYHIRFVPSKRRFGDSDSGSPWPKNVNHLLTSHSLSQI